MKECIKCGKELADDAAFCNACGAKQTQEPKTCSNCGAPIDEGNAFCSKCGTKQGENPITPATSERSYDEPNYERPNFLSSSKMTFFEAVKTCFLNYANFKGRASRSEFWYFSLFNSIVAIILMIIGGMPSKYHNNTMLTLYNLAVFCPALAVSWRRLHDIGKSGKSYLINLIPIIGGIIFIVWAAQDSQHGTNQYGHNPKGE